MDRAKTFKKAMSQVQEWMVWAADIYEEEGKDVKMALVVFCHHCLVELSSDMNSAGSRISGPWLVYSYCKKNLCGPKCTKLCWGAEPIETNAPNSVSPRAPTTVKSVPAFDRTGMQCTLCSMSA